MKKIFLLGVSALLTASGITAKQIDVKTAQQVAENFFNQGQTLRSTASGLQLVHTERAEGVLRSTQDVNNYYYAFNAGNNRGFIIVSAEDAITPVIAYSNEGSFDPSNLPDAFSYMLSVTSENIRSAIETGKGASGEVAEQWNSYKSGQVSSTLRSTASAVAPMLKTTWWQGEPYNNSLVLPNGIKAYTGCVPTAVAQIMKYHKWPIVTTPDPTNFPYTITYDWENMLNSYANGAGTTAQKNAVANLMLSLFIGMQADILQGNTIVQPTMAKAALVAYNSYDARMGFRIKDNVRHKEWVDLIKREIAKSRPVLYMATTPPTNDNPEPIGHAFVCDGYDSSGLIHINMGWEDTAFNVYYNIDSQDGIKVSASSGDRYYNTSQMIYTNIRPKSAGSDEVLDAGTHYMVLNGDMKISADVVNLGASFETNIAISGAGMDLFTGTLGVVLTDNAGNVKHVAAQQNVTNFVPFQSTIVRFPTCTTPSAYGTYVVRAAYKATGSANWTLVSNEDLVDRATITLAGNNFSAGNLVNLTSFSSVTTRAAQGASFVATNMSIYNSATTGEFRGYCAVALTDASDKVKYILTPNMAGTYTSIRAAGTLPFGGYETCSVPLNAVPGTYRLRLVYKTLGDSPNDLSDWKIVKNRNAFTVSYVNFTVTAATRSVIGEEAEDYGAKVQVYPNPITDILNVSSDVLIKEISLYDMSGKLVLKNVGMGSQQQVNVSSLPNGIYLLKVESLNGSTTHKINKK